MRALCPVRSQRLHRYSLPVPRSPSCRAPASLPTLGMGPWCCVSSKGSSALHLPTFLTEESLHFYRARSTAEGKGERVIGTISQIMQGYTCGFKENSCTSSKSDSYICLLNKDILNIVTTKPNKHCNKIVL